MAEHILQLRGRDARREIDSFPQNQQLPQNFTKYNNFSIFVHFTDIFSSFERIYD